MIALDPCDHASLQRQVYVGIRHAILTGRLSRGALVPSSRAIATDLGVSRTTTLLALEQLVAEGYLTTRPALGTFVALELPDELPAARSPRLAALSRPADLSRRGAALAQSRQGALRLGVAPRPFRIGSPAVDLFPTKLWARLTSRQSRSMGPAQLEYSDPAGLLALRQAIAEQVNRSRAAECEPGQVIVVAGAQQGLDLACRVLLDPGDAAWLEDPGYPGARSALIAAGAEIAPIPVDEEGLDVEAGTRRAAAARVAYVTPSHQYPLGVVMSLPRRVALLRWASRAGAWIIEDDYDSEFRHGARPIPSLRGLGLDARVIYVGSFSKTLFPALRLGFLLVPPSLHQSIVAARAAADQQPPMLEQLILAEFIGEGHLSYHLRRMREAYRERLEALTDAARRLCGGVLRLRETMTGLHAVADLDGVPADSVVGEAARRGIEVAALSSYSAEPLRAVNGLVLGFGAVEPSRLWKGMEGLAAAIEAARRRAI